MEFKSEQKYTRISPTKVRPLTRLVKSMGVEKSLEVLPLIRKRGAVFLAKVVKSAVANAYQKGFSVSDLEFKEIVVNEGPRLKRGRPVSRGMWHPYVRKTSHIRVVLVAKGKDGEKTGVVSKNNEKEIKKVKAIKKDGNHNKRNLDVASSTKKKSNKSVKVEKNKSKQK